MSVIYKKYVADILDLEEESGYSHLYSLNKFDEYLDKNTCKIIGYCLSFFTIGYVSCLLINYL